MKTHLHLSICPFCGHANELTNSVGDPEAKPEDGDYSICFKCTRVAVFDSSYPAGARRPNAVELTDIASNTQIFNAIIALKAAKNGLITKGQSS